MFSTYTDLGLEQRLHFVEILRAKIATNQETIRTKIALYEQELENSDQTLAVLGELITEIEKEQDRRSAAIDARP